MSYLKYVVGLSLLANFMAGFSMVSAKDLATESAVRVDDSTRTSGTKIKDYERRTNTRRSLRTAADHMLTAAKKDQSQVTPPGKLTTYRKNKLNDKTRTQQVTPHSQTQQQRN